MELPLTPKKLSISEIFTLTYHHKPTIIVESPGRAEIIGNHTDYNQGYAIGAAINKYTFAAISRRQDNRISVFSENYDKSPHIFPIKGIRKRVNNHWTNYVKAVTYELSRKKPIKRGFNMYITSDVPSSGGVSSSAALELAIGLGLIKLYNIKLNILELALLCQKAENGPLVDSPCGFLDQATSALSKKNNFLFLDFLPKKGIPISKYEYIPIELNKHDLSFLIVVDKNIKRNLGESGYPERRKTCERSLTVLSKLLKRKIKSLREVSIAEFEKCKKELDKLDNKMRMRVEHIVYENQRVLDSVAALKNDDILTFGKLLTESGRSALELYELDEKTPELTFLINSARSMDGVLGVRNMGGGFSANILVLIKNPLLNRFKNKMITAYNKKYHGNLEFIGFFPSEGAKLRYIN